MNPPLSHGISSQLRVPERRQVPVVCSKTLDYVEKVGREIRWGHFSGVASAKWGCSVVLFFLLSLLNLAVAGRVSGIRSFQVAPHAHDGSRCARNFTSRLRF
jgi:hypothetical protein